jgi:nitrate reductase gamma subunit
MTGLSLIIISYLLLLFFLVMFFYKARKIAGLPPHLRWELAPIPHEKGKSQYGGSYLEEYEWWTKAREKSLVDEVLYMLKEILFLKGVFENNKKLWYFSFPFHLGLYLIAGMVFLMFINAILLSTSLNQVSSIIEAAIYIAAGIGYIIGGLGTVGLIIKRLADPNLKNFNTSGSLFNLLFLLLVFISGGHSLVSVPSFSGEMTHYAKALLTADTSLLLPGLISLHCVLSLLFLAYLPFTKMLHFLAKYFTYHEVRWNDIPMKGNGHMEKDIKKHLNQPVTWAAPHLKADGKKNWVDIVTEGNKA